MNGDIELTLWLHKYKLEALTSALAEQNTTVEKRMDRLLYDLYVEVVPEDVQEDIQNRINAEITAMEAELEASRTCAVLRVREQGRDSFFQTGHQENLLDIGKFVRRFLRQEKTACLEKVQASFSDLTPISAEQYYQMMEAHLENPNKITDVFEVDFDQREVSSVGIGRDWRTYSMKDISTAFYFAYRKSGLGPFQQEVRFENKLAGKTRPSAGHLSTREISFANGICEIDGHRLNFYMDSFFDVDAVFGTHVRTAKNDDIMNVYANYDMVTGQVCDLLEVNLYLVHGRKEVLGYQLNAVEKRNLLRKMDEYCQQQTGQTLKEYSAQRMAEEEMPPPTQPNM